MMNVSRLLLVGILVTAFALATIFPAYAAKKCPCGICESCLAIEFSDQETWFHEEVFILYFLPAWMLMTEQFSAMAMYQMLIIGNFFDATQQIKAQRLRQELAALAHKDYQPSAGMCTFGTNVRTLAVAERNGEFNVFAMARRSQDRQLGKKNVSAAEGWGSDLSGRFEQMTTRYCNATDHGGAYKEICAEGQSAPAETLNKDINFADTVGKALTLDVDFTTPDLENDKDEQDVWALANNLYATKVPFRFPEFALSDPAKQIGYLDMRSVIAKRSVAEQSYNTIVGMKAEGGEDAEKTGAYMSAILKQLGVPEDDIPFMLGGIGTADTDTSARPSYYAQMEVLGQKIYQNPSFYMNLYDTPINVIRKDVAMQAIDLMTDRSLYKSELRTEALLSVLLETEIMTYQEAVQNRMAGVTNKGK
ncbi:MAG: hypothetical protein KDJ15_06340 [Alphaproteobacteria bacterium]|nr:hypothetical protein [Alphaproteobacteria bacterium]